MKAFIIPLWLIIVSSNLFSQSIDSLFIVNNTLPNSVYIKGIFPHTGLSINRIESSTSVFADTVWIDIYIRECAGYLGIVPFDTLFTPNIAGLVINNLQVRTIIDTNTVDTTNCLYRNYTNRETRDSVFISTSQANINELNSLLYDAIKIYPNPSKGLINMEYPRELDVFNISLIGLQGKKVKRFKEPQKQLSISGISTGQYFLKLETSKGIITKKVLIE